jgi:predicted RNA binding protein YcfA (HicA-like mRNA interferase family)
MKREDLIRDLRRFARKNGLAFDLLRDKGKGSHDTVKVGDRTTTVQSGELKPLWIKRILRQLEIDPDAF